MLTAGTNLPIARNPTTDNLECFKKTVYSLILVDNIYNEYIIFT